MSTQTALKAQIVNDIRNRSDLTTQIAYCIADAITHWQRERFFFNETRSSTFTTVADQASYTSSDDADIPKFYKIDFVTLTDSGGIVYELERIDHEDMEHIQFTGTSSGRPYAYSYFAETFWLYPIPDVSTYTIRPVGHIELAAPASDGEANNAWMTKAYDLIRYTAEERLFRDILIDTERAAIARTGKEEALLKLLAWSSKKTATGMIKATTF